MGLGDRIRLFCGGEKEGVPTFLCFQENPFHPEEFLSGVPSTFCFSEETGFEKRKGFSTEPIKNQK
ncbi:hypothetical protein A0128_13435 [Leptospira tipperaryensis]|uniref:Uncharacterized protein n=1 Tax=Leptospira tipperaryensis TaxID=2564040 RepID=A0A1D7UYU5_9LEPT|nr:hypothetical protein A0128_13435 [Leptospira tipperaryensis]